MSDKPLPPGTTGLPVLGETLAFAKNSFDFVSDRVAKHGNVWKTSLLGKKAVFLAGAEAADAFIDPDNCVRFGSMPGSVLALFGGVAVNSLDGDAHKTRKKVLMSAFNRSALEAYHPALEEVVQAELGRWATGQAIPLIPGMRRLAVAAISHTVMGQDDSELIDSIVADYNQVARGFGAVPVNLPITAFGRAKRAVDGSIARLAEVVAERRQRPSDDGVSRMIEFAATNEPGLTDLDIARELHHVVVAGFIVFAEFATLVIELGHRPDVREKLASEIRDHVGSEAVTLAHLAGMGYLRQVLLETKRITPVVPVAIGMAKRSFEVSGYKVPEGWMLAHIIHESMQDPVVFAKPTEFDPGRFASQSDEHQNPAVVAQGAGEYFGRGHLCAGVDFSTQLMGVFVIHLVRDHEWDLPEQNLSLDTAQLPPVPEDGLIARIRRKAVPS